MKKPTESVTVTFAIAIGLILVSFTGQCQAALQVGFYKDKCGAGTDVEEIVSSVVERTFRKDPTIAAALIRLHFHDCFVNGCDASILLDGSSTEKKAPPNLTVRGYDIIDEAKEEIENKFCKETVSCADIIAMAARDAVNLTGGGKYAVETGRKDGFQPAKKVDLPSPDLTVSEAIEAFKGKQLDPTDMVLLLGGHTIGVTHCSLFNDRLYNFQGRRNTSDPTMDTALVEKLKSICPENSAGNKTVDLDQNSLSSLTMDNSFYKQIALHRGVLQLDQRLALDPLTNETVAELARSNDFPVRFGQAMVKLGAVGVVTDSSRGEIRKSCRVSNDKNNNSKSPTSLI